MRENNHPFYRNQPIGSVEALSRALGVELLSLRKLADRADSLYRGPIPVRKKGKIRETFDAKPELKRLHGRILRRILGKVTFPDYLMGGIADPERKRGYIRNAWHHAGAALLIGEDVSDFFPSISFDRVRRIFLHVFHFPLDVADTLARLCTRHGVVPQGARTSTAIANLALYDVEPELVEELQRRNILYTRFIDDIHASTKRRLSEADRTNLVQIIRSVLERTGFRPKRKKQFVAHRGTQITVHRLNVNNAVSRDRSSRKNLRLELLLLEKMVKSDELATKCDRLLRRISSKIRLLKTTNPGSASALHKLLDSILVERRRREGRSLSQKAL